MLYKNKYKKFELKMKTKQNQIVVIYGKPKQWNCIITDIQVIENDRSP